MRGRGRDEYARRGRNDGRGGRFNGRGRDDRDGQRGRGRGRFEPGRGRGRGGRGEIPSKLTLYVIEIQEAELPKVWSKLQLPIDGRFNA